MLGINGATINRLASLAGLLGATSMRPLGILSGFTVGTSSARQKPHIRHDIASVYGELKEPSVARCMVDSVRNIELHFGHLFIAGTPDRFDSCFFWPFFAGNKTRLCLKPCQGKDAGL
jgi:hypothetical protein